MAKTRVKRTTRAKARVRSTARRAKTSGLALMARAKKGVHATVGTSDAQKNIARAIGGAIIQSGVPTLISALAGRQLGPVSGTLSGLAVNLAVSSVTNQPAYFLGGAATTAAHITYTKLNEHVYNITGTYLWGMDTQTLADNATPLTYYDRSHIDRYSVPPESIDIPRLKEYKPDLAENPVLQDNYTSSLADNYANGFDNRMSANARKRRYKRN